MERVEKLLNLVLERKRMLEFALFDEWSEKDGRFAKVSKEITDLAASIGVFVVNRFITGTDYSFQFDSLDYIKGVSDETGIEITVSIQPDKEYIYHSLDIQIDDTRVQLLYLEEAKEHKKAQAI